MVLYEHVSGIVFKA